MKFIDDMYRVIRGRKCASSNLVPIFRISSINEVIDLVMQDQEGLTVR